MLADYYLRHQNFSRAAELIAPLLGGGTQLSDIDCVAARRVQTSLLASQAGQGYAKLQEAIELIDRNLASPLATTQDKRLRSASCWPIPPATTARKCSNWPAALLNTGGVEPEPDDRFQLARLYLARGVWEGCREQMEKLLNGGQSNPGYLSAWVRMLLDCDQLNDAGQWLERLERLSASAETVAFRAELMFRLKKWGEVPGFLDAYLRPNPRSGWSGRSSPPKCWRILAAGSRKPGKWAWPEVTLTRPAPGTRPMPRQDTGSQMLLAGFHARHGKLSDALDLLDRFGVKATPLDLAIAVDAAIRCENITPQQLQQVEKVLAAADTCGTQGRSPC